MEHKILIDANVFLRFYDTKDGAFKALLEFIEKISTKIFVTEQTKNEIFRNKIEVAITSFTNLEKNLKVKGAELPIQFSDPDSKKWNEYVGKMSSLQEEQKKIFGTLLKAISENRDNVSIRLDSILSKAKPFDEATFSKAERRKKLGIPPGKKNDPIGDELTWEQFLGSVQPSDRVIIVSYDGDYIDSYNDESFLNPVLVNDLIGKGIPRGNIFPFHKLIEFYKKFKDELNTAIDLSEELAKKISKEEAVPPANFGGYGTYSGYAGATGAPSNYRTSAAAAPAGDFGGYGTYSPSQSGTSLD